MSIYAIGDLHLSFSSDKPMDVFGADWADYVNRIECNWKNTINDNDTVLVAGDVSWGMNAETAIEDLKFINNLPGRKIIGKGNHDYWWNTMGKLDRLKSDNRLNTIDFLFNNAYDLGDAYVIGTRGWMEPETGSSDENNIKIYNRELGRLNLSIDYLNNIKKEEKPIIAMFHYPTINFDGSKTVFQKRIEEICVDVCIFGHLHSHSCYKFKIPNDCSSHVHLVSGDYLQFFPYKINF